MPESETTEVADVSTALAALDAALQTSEGRQREFLMSVSHELRTPLTTIRGYAEGLADGVVAPDEAADVGRVLVEESLRLEQYVADLLALSRLEADDFELRPASVDVAGIVSAAREAWADRATRAAVALSAEVGGGDLTVTTDGARLRQVLDVLLDNAVRICPADGQVVVAAEATGSSVRVTVRDSGPGLTPDDVELAFEPGALHARHPDRAGGAGLGLALARRLAARLGGTLTVDHAPEGGAAFVVELPK